MKENLKYYRLASTLAFFFVLLGYVVKFYPHTLDFENSFQTFLRGNLPPLKTSFFSWITQFANPLSLILLTIAMMIFFYLQREKIASLYLGLNLILGAGLLNHFVKQVYQRPRPPLKHLVTETSFSFPSGHAMGSMIFFGSLIFLMPLITNHRLLRSFLKSLCFGMIFLIGLSRIYLGVHYLSDIIGGYLLGLTWLFATYPLYQKIRARYLVKMTWKKVKE